MEKVSRFKVNLETFEVQKLDQDFRNGGHPYTHNGQHVQLLGFVLAEINNYEHGGKEKTQILLFHPETGPESGHVDLYIDITKGEKPTFHQYCHHIKINVADEEELGYFWPTGQLSLIQTMAALTKVCPELLSGLFNCIPPTQPEEELVGIL